MSTPQHKHNKESLLTSVAESIGSTLGTIVSQASEMPEAISHGKLASTAEREGRKLLRRGQAVARRIGNATPRKVKKLAKAIRRKVQGGKKSVKRVARPSAAKREIASRGRRSGS